MKLVHEFKPRPRAIYQNGRAVDFRNDWDVQLREVIQAAALGTVIVVPDAIYDVVKDGLQTGREDINLISAGAWARETAAQQAAEAARAVPAFVPETRVPVFTQMAKGALKKPAHPEKTVTVQHLITAAGHDLA